ncbi:MAG: SpoIIE family protein phosphatase, partial [Actinomycetota bacterium]|nr:SpoIIE family protein phosphatase [Actinomycetota bacterium]
RSIITRALGMEPEIEVDSWEIIPFQGDRILLCSDGLTNELSDERIASTLRQLADPQEAARDLVRQARAAGGSDNITVVVVDVVDDDGRSQRASAELSASAGSTSSLPTPPPTVSSPLSEVEPSGARVAAPPAPDPPSARQDEVAPSPAETKPKRWTWRVVVFLFAVFAVLGAAVWAVAWYARGAYFVGLDGDQVAIYRGRPGGLLWFDPILVEHKAQPTGAELLPAQRMELEAGHEVASKAAADRYVNNLRQEVELRRVPPTTTTLVPPPMTATAPTAPATTSRP